MAANGREAADMIERAAYDLVLMDMQMPVMDGLEEPSTYAGCRNRTTLPILAMTANAFAEGSGALPGRWHERFHRQADQSESALFAGPALAGKARLTGRSGAITRR
ncbi:MAG: response regulator [Betaproteobacteria bacterium]|nr:response regulator [Betaproteobacteria bacterium]